jgi:hypothetical protein
MEDLNSAENLTNDYSDSDPEEAQSLGIHRKKAVGFLARAEDRGGSRLAKKTGKVTPHFP